MKINIIRASCFFKAFFKSLFVLLAIGFVASWIAIFAGIKPMPHHAITSFMQGFCWTITSLLFLYSLIDLFHQYAKGEIFSLKNVMIMRNLGYILLAKEMIAALFLAIGHSSALFGLIGINIQNLVISGLLILNSWIINESYCLKEEHQLTI